MSASITVLLNVYRRPEYFRSQLDAIRLQTVPADQVWVWRNHHPEGQSLDLRSEPGIDRWIDSNFNWMFYGRFAAALLADTEYVAMFDDDTIPGPMWFQNCLDTMARCEGILGSAGVKLTSAAYSPHLLSGWSVKNPEVERVDLVGHAWFFRREWLKYLWMQKPFDWRNGEDIQFSYLAQRYGGLQTYCPPHPPNAPWLHGSIIELGRDAKGTSQGNIEQHRAFIGQRDACVRHALAGGWKTVLSVG